jgi:acetoin utilization deacetylase AcuC-like enzyme
LFTHPACLAHDPGHGHPESPDRLRAVLGGLEAEEFALLDRREASAATREQLLRAHPGSYVDWVLNNVPSKGLVRLDPDTAMSPASGEAALRAVGAVCAAVDAVAAGEVRNAFCAVRPPGHHAEPARAMGFCIFNSVALGAYHARAAHGLKRVAVVDFDVHHGNGTQAMFEADADLFYASTHQSPLYPGTGSRAERGVGNILNLPLPPMSGSADFRAAVEREMLPALDAFKPEFVLVSAGFDAHADDPLAQLYFTDADFKWVTEKLLGLASRHAKGRLVSSLEGGYNLAALASSARAHVRALMNA